MLKAIITQLTHRINCIPNCRLAKTCILTFVYASMVGSTDVGGVFMVAIIEKEITTHLSQRPYIQVSYSTHTLKFTFLGDDINNT